MDQRPPRASSSYTNCLTAPRPWRLMAPYGALWRLCPTNKLSKNPPFVGEIFSGRQTPQDLGQKLSRHWTHPPALFGQRQWKRSRPLGMTQVSARSIVLQLAHQVKESIPDVMNGRWKIWKSSNIYLETQKYFCVYACLRILCAYVYYIYIYIIHIISFCPDPFRPPCACWSFALEGEFPAQPRCLCSAFESAVADPRTHGPESPDSSSFQGNRPPFKKNLLNRSNWPWRGGIHGYTPFSDTHMNEFRKRSETCCGSIATHVWTMARGQSECSRGSLSARPCAGTSKRSRTYGELQWWSWDPVEWKNVRIH